MMSFGLYLPRTKDIMLLHKQLICLFLMILVVFVNVDCQKTYKRGCDCEYMVDGQCAYTLMLPANDGGNGYCPNQGNSDLQELKNSIQQLNGNVSNLQKWQFEMSRQVNMIHEVILMKEYNMVANKSDIDELKAKLEQLSSKVEVISQTSSYAFNMVDTLQSTLSTTVRDLNALILEHNSTKQEVMALRKELADVRQNWCSGRDLLVSGQKSSIPDDQIYVSSTYNADHGPEKARITWAGQPGSWCPTEPNQDEWLMFDLGTPRTIFGVLTRGRQDYAQWVTSYKVQYTNQLAGNETVWITNTDPIGADQIFVGNSDTHSLHTNMLWQPFTAQYVRIVPLTANGNNRCMRADLIGCVDS